MKNSKIVDKIKSTLVRMAIQDTLPSNMTMLDVTFIEDILDERDEELSKEEPYRNAVHYLAYSDDEDALSAKQQVQLIEQQAKIDSNLLIDWVDGVQTCEEFEYVFTCEEFLSIIGLQ